MPKSMQVKIIKAINNITENLIQKAESKQNLNNQETNENFIYPPYSLRALKDFVNHSTILPQCIRSYKNNIAGFGLEVKYKDDYNEETPEMIREFEKAEEIRDLLNIDMDTKEVFEKLIESRETYGIGYLEIIRSLDGQVIQIDFIEDTETIFKTPALDPAQDYTYFYKGKEIKHKKKFRKYKQVKAGKTIYFKEFGDPRIMDKRTGEYLKEGQTLELQYQANEIMEFKVGTGEYGTVRWIGQLLNIDGSRRAENLNNNYFLNGRHTPLMIVIKGGTLSDESWEKLQNYMNDIKGENGQHAFIVLEAEDNENKTDLEGTKPVEVELKDLAGILQKDELFQDYLENSRKKIQSSFLLPDLYTGYTSDFNRATAQTAMEITEKQVFMPERKSLAWQINHRLLNGYNFKYVTFYFKGPDLSNVDDIVKALNIAERAGGLLLMLLKNLLCRC
ncbi:phage portal protein [Caloranaerobacter azorensis]|uniref:Phage portal protein n=1 Tax=Caloranaerobacter azorensis TaxID=116090 RepID=A0A6P1YB49_9FIRM|nr:phage portal protein [Caloranaerobacter azorensis]QIB26088.1 phage portal protein [Caloranaerobacter azorensis]